MNSDFELRHERLVAPGGVALAGALFEKKISFVLPRQVFELSERRVHQIPTLNQ